MILIVLVLMAILPNFDKAMIISVSNKMKTKIVIENENLIIKATGRVIVSDADENINELCKLVTANNNNEPLQR